jgi:hypothetical protein
MDEEVLVRKEVPVGLVGLLMHFQPGTTARRGNGD